MSRLFTGILVAVAAPKPHNEDERLRALVELEILDTEAEAQFDRITRLASQILGVPIALVSLVDTDRQWFKSRVGLDATQTPREHAFCAHAILDEEPMLVRDAQSDARFRDNPLVQGPPNVRFYLGAPLIVGKGLRVGTLCAIDRAPRDVSESEVRALNDLAKIVVDELELRLANRRLRAVRDELREANEALEHFTHMAAHDLRAPLKSIASLCDLAGAAEPAGAAEFVAMAGKEARAAEQIVASYFQLSRLRTVTPQPRPIGIVEMVRQAADGTIPDWVEVVGDVVVAGDPALLTQLFKNVLQNAQMYGTGVLTIASKNDDGHCVVLCRNRTSERAGVEDSILRPFRRRSERGSGAGLGLSIVGAIVRAHGGDVSARLDGETFELRVEFPCAPPEEIPP